MQNGIHFISGLPRSGSTLLAALLRQNPRVHAAMTSPAAELVNVLMHQMSQKHETSVFVDDTQRLAILRACVAAYYDDIHPTKLVFDTSRSWTTKLPLLSRMYPKARIVCCVRNPAWVLDSVERLLRANPLEPSGLVGYDAVGTVYARAEAMMGASGMIGFALSALREAVFDERRERLLLVRFESLTENTLETLARIYDFIGEPAFTHDPEHVEQDYDALMFDARLGANGLHTVGSRVRPVHRPTILPPDIFARYEPNAFWDKPGEMPQGVRVI